MVNSNNKDEIEIKSNLSNYINTSLVHIPELEIIEDIFDIRVVKKSYRFFVSKTFNKIYCNEIVSYNYKGLVVLKNPVNKEMSEKLAKILFGANLPKNEWLDTIKDLRKKALKKKQENKPKKRNKVGRKPEVNLIRATLFCIKNHNYETAKTYKETIERASKLFKLSEQNETSFKNMIAGKWRKFREQHRLLPQEIKETKNRYQYAKEILKIPRSKKK